MIGTRAELVAKLASITAGSWLIERRIIGRELSVGVLGGKAMGIVEIRPKSGVYDYTSKYTKGMTEYFAPAPLEPAVTAKVQASAEAAFAACGCIPDGQMRNADCFRKTFAVLDAAGNFLDDDGTGDLSRTMPAHSVGHYP